MRTLEIQMAINEYINKPYDFTISFAENCKQTEIDFKKMDNIITSPIPKSPHPNKQNRFSKIFR